MKTSVKRWHGLWIPICVLVFVACVVAFVAVWIGSWSLAADAYPDARTYWRDFALPRAARSAVVGLPLAFGAAIFSRALLLKRAEGADDGTTP